MRRQEVKAHSMNLNMVLQILCLDGQEKRAKPLKRSEISTHPEEVNFPQPRLHLRVVEPIPDTLQDTGKWCNADTCANQNCNLVFKDVLRG